MTEQGIHKNEVDIHKQMEVEALMSGASPTSDVASELIDTVSEHARIGQRKRSVFLSMKGRGHRRTQSSHSSLMTTSQRGQRDSGSTHLTPEPQRDALAFNKEEVLATPHGTQKVFSPLSAALAASPPPAVELQAAKPVPSNRMRVRVFMPIEASDQDGDEIDIFIDIDALKNQTGRSLIEECLSLWTNKDKSEGSKELKTDPELYELWIAEEDGEIDDDLPALNLATSIEDIGQDTFALVPKEAAVGDTSRPDGVDEQRDTQEDTGLRDGAFGDKPKGCCILM